MLSALIRKRQKLFTIEEFSKETGIPEDKILEMETGIMGFMTSEQRSYVNTLKWRIMVTPDKKRKYYKRLAKQQQDEGPTD